MFARRSLVEPVIRTYFQRWMIVRPYNVYVVSYPRSGNTWIRFLLAYMLYPDDDDVENRIRKTLPDQYEKAKHWMLWTKKEFSFIKSHELYCPRYPSVIYLYRDGRDVCVSYWDWYQRIRGYSGSFHDFFDLYVEGRVIFGTWKNHVESWLSRAHSIPFLPVKYEDLYTHTYDQLRRIAEFLNKDIHPDVIQNAIEQTLYNNLLKRGTYSGGVKGAPGKWKEVFTAEDEARFWEHAGGTLLKYGYDREECHDACSG